MATNKSRGIPCRVLLNGKNGYCATPLEAKSISAGLRLAKGSGWFRYRIIAGGKVVREGFCD